MKTLYVFYFYILVIKEIHFWKFSLNLCLSTGFRSPQFDTKSSDLSSDDTYDDRVTIVTDSVEEDMPR